MFDSTTMHWHHSQAGVETLEIHYLLQRCIVPLEHADVEEGQTEGRTDVEGMLSEHAKHYDRASLLVPEEKT